MKKIFFIIILVLPFIETSSQTPTAHDPVLYGVIKKEILVSSPYDKWYVTGYENYQPSVEWVQSIRKLDTKGISIDIFFGSWCGDSRRELPRFMKLLDAISFPLQQARIIAVGGADSLLKQSPSHEENGKGVFRVPVFIVYKNGVEINRINEYPVFSLERDLYTILSNQSYTPNYRSFATIRTWLNDGTLTDKNNNSQGLAMQLRPFFPGEREMNSLGYLLMGQGKKQEALKIFQINASLFPESANVLSSLGEGYLKNGDKQNAIRLLERSLELNKDPLLVQGILKILYQAKE
jgi:tetratricopeptide (TPR) repeat protein